MHDGCERSNRVGHVIGAVGKGQQGCREHQRDTEQGLQRLVAVLHSFRLFPDQRRSDHIGDGADCQTDHQGRADVDLDHPLQAFQRQIGAKCPGHDPHQNRHPAPSGGNLVVLIDDLDLDEGQESCGNGTAQNRGNHPAGGDLAHGWPVYRSIACSGDACTHHAAHDRVGGRDRRSDPGCQVDPESG